MYGAIFPNPYKSSLSLSKTAKEFKSKRKPENRCIAMYVNDPRGLMRHGTSALNGAGVLLV